MLFVLLRILSAASLLWNPAEVLAQSTEVTTCVQEYQWALNSKQQNPCLVAAYLETTCLGRRLSTWHVIDRSLVPSPACLAYIVPAIPPKTHYLPPNASEANPCLCNTVYYSLISACGGCQGRTYANWTDWSMNCPQIFVATFPRDIPPATEVPGWANLNVTQTNNNFDPLKAQLFSQQGLGGSTSAQLTSQAPPTSSTILLPTTDASPIPTSSSTVTSSQAPAGAIAGGVVGGIAFLAAVGLAIFWYRSRRDEGNPGQTGSMVGSWVRKQNKRRKQSNARIDLDEDVPPITPFPPSLSQKPDPRYEPSSPTSGLTAPGTVMQTVQDLRTVTSPSPAQGLSSITSSPYGHTRDLSDPVSPIASAFYTTGGRNSVDTLPYTGSQVTRGPYTGAAEI